MRRITFLALMLIVGCSLTAPVDGKKPDKPDVKPIVEAEHAPAAEIWRALAHRVEMGVITTPKQLARFVRELGDAGELLQADQSAFDSAFPGAATDQSELNPDNAYAKLRGIK